MSVKYGLLLVDDDVWVRKSVIKQIAWDDLNIFLVADVADGQQALDILAHHQVDIVLTDVMMGVVDGIELSQQINELYPAIKVIVFSGYSEYDLIRQAMHYKVFDYILKPVESKNINDTLFRAIHELDKNNLGNHNPQKVSYWAKTMEYYKDILLMEMFKGNIKWDSNLSNNWIEDFQWTQKNYAVAYMRCYNFKNKPNDMQATIREMIINSLNDCLSDLIILDDEQLGEYNFILSFVDLNLDTEGYINSCESLKKLFQDFLSDLNRRVNLGYHVGISEYFKTMENLHIAYNQAYQASEGIFEDGRQFVHFFNDSQQTRLIALILDYINKNFSQNITLESVSMKFNYNYSYLSRIFKQTTGVSFIEYINNFRIKKAKALLAEPSVKINEISHMLGFENTNYFSRIFRKTTGITPSDYRERVLNKI